MWSIRSNMPAQSIGPASRPRSLALGRLRRGRGRDHAQAHAGRAFETRDLGHDALDRVAVQHLVLEQLVRELLQRAAMGDDHALRRPPGLLDPVLAPLVADA